MPATTVRSTDTYEAIHTSESDWQDVIRGWMSGHGATPEQIEEYVSKFEAGVAEAGLARPWLINTDRGIGIIAPHDFVKWYEDVAATDVLIEIFQEMKRHGLKGYGIAHDDAHDTAHFVEVIGFYLNPLGRKDNVLPDDTKRREFIKAASVAVAAVNKIDRAKDARTFSAD